MKTKTIDLGARIAHHLGKEMRKDNNQSATIAFFALSSLADLGTSYCNDFLSQARGTLHRVSVADITSETERRAIKAEGKNKTEQAKIKKAWEKAVKTDAQTMLDNFVAWRDMFKTLSDHIEQVSPRNRQTIDDLNDLIYDFFECLVDKQKGGGK